jgi:hypothetical protein
MAAGQVVKLMAAVHSSAVRSRRVRGFGLDGMNR